MPRNCGHGPALVLAVVCGAGLLPVVAVVAERRADVLALVATCVVAGDVTAVVGAAWPDADVWPAGEVVWPGCDVWAGDVWATAVVCVVTTARLVDDV